MKCRNNILVNGSYGWAGLLVNDPDYLHGPACCKEDGPVGQFVCKWSPKPNYMYILPRRLLPSCRK